MEKQFLNRFYLDKEKDIVINLYQTKKDEISYLLETPNHKKGTLITNLAKICRLETIKNERDMKVITGTLPASINGDNEEVYILRMGGIKIANIFLDGRIEIKAKIPAITKTLMSQTKDYNIDIQKTIVKSYIFKKSKFRTDLHTHMNANLSPDCLIALGIKHQIRYPLYYIKKLNLKMSQKQEEAIVKQRKEVEKQFETKDITGKYFTRKVDDHTFINFADFILNNLENAEENIQKIRTSLAILKDGQAVFTNLEKLYIYRYVFAKGASHPIQIALEKEKIEKIPEQEIKEMVFQMQKDGEKGSQYEKNTLRQDKLLWIAREYQKQGIQYVEITDTDLAKKGDPAIKLLEEVHEVMPKIEKETDVKIRFLCGIRRIPLTILRDQKTSGNYLRENLDVLKAVAKSPYVVGSDFIGEEINDISELKPVIQEIVQYVGTEDPEFTIRIHAGENDSLRDNVEKSIECIETSLKPGQKMPHFRIGHGLYTPSLESEEGKKLIEKMKRTGAILEFQLTSNVRLNNLTNLEKHPLKTYLENGIKCVQGTDGCGFYGVDTIDEQLALQNLIGLQENDFKKMRQVEEEIIKRKEKYFKDKKKKFKEFLAGRSIREAILQKEEENERESRDSKIQLRLNDNLESIEVLEEKVKELPQDKYPIVIAGGSFNGNNRETAVTEEGTEILREFIEKLDTKKIYFVIGHKMQGYEKIIIDLAKKQKETFEVYAIIPKKIAKEVYNRIQKEPIDGIRISIENDEAGIYKSFNYEIFERRSFSVIAFDGNSPVSNLVQEAKNGKGKAKIYVNIQAPSLEDKAKMLRGYVTPFQETEKKIIEKMIQDHQEI